MKRHFITGLVILLPIALTFAIVSFFLNFLTAPFASYIKEAPFNDLLLKVAAVLVVLLGLTVIGFLCQTLALHYVFKWADALFHRIPLLNRVYKAAQDVMQSLFSTDKPSFSQAVLVPFPMKGNYAVGFLVSKSLPEGSDLDDPNLMSIFVPGTPNPMMGFMLLIKKEDVIPIDLPVDDAVRFVVSCGVKFPGCRVGVENKR